MKFPLNYDNMYKAIQACAITGLVPYIVSEPGLGLFTRLLCTVTYSCRRR